MEIFQKKLLDEYKNYVGIKKQYTIIAGKIHTRYKSKILYQGILKTRYFKHYADALNHYKIELIAQGKILKTNNIILKKIA